MLVWSSKGQPDTNQESAASEAELVTAAQTDPLAFDALYRRYLPQVYRYVRSQVPDREDASDLTQQIFLQALDALPAYRVRGLPFAAWLFRIARNVVIDSYRKHKNATVPFDELPEALHPASGSDPLSELLEREREQQLHTMLNRLDQPKRDLLALRFAGQLTSTEIAEVVGKSPAAVQKQLTRILAELKGQYHDA